MSFSYSFSNVHLSFPSADIQNALQEFWVCNWYTTILSRETATLKCNIWCKTLWGMWAVVYYCWTGIYCCSSLAIFWHWWFPKSQSSAKLCDTWWWRQEIVFWQCTRQVCQRVSNAIFTCYSSWSITSQPIMICELF